MTSFSSAESLGPISSLAAALPTGHLLMLMALPFTLTVAFVEWFHFRHSDKYDASDTMASIVMAAVYILLADGLMVVAEIIFASGWRKGNIGYINAQYTDSRVDLPTRNEILQPER